MIICHLSYRLDTERIDAFVKYGRIWVDLIQRHGGTHHGYFLAAEVAGSRSFSFPGLGRAGPRNAAFAIFSFPDLEAYERYRLNVRADPECGIAERLLEESGCVLSYERTFVERIA